MARRVGLVELVRVEVILAVGDCVRPIDDHSQLSSETAKHASHTERLMEIRTRGLVALCIFIFRLSFYTVFV
jgi:hypothetical protein